MSDSVWLDLNGKKQLTTSARIKYGKDTITEEICLPGGQVDGNSFVRTFVRDFQSRTISKSESNGGQSLIIYDRQGRARFSQDEQLRQQGKIAYQKYDHFGRLTMEGIFTAAWDEEELQKKQIFKVSQMRFPTSATPMMGTEVIGTILAC